MVNSFSVASDIALLLLLKILSYSFGERLPCRSNIFFPFLWAAYIL